MMVGKVREELGKRVRQIWVDYCREIGDTKPAHLAPWEELSETDKEVDRRIGEQLFMLGRTPGANIRSKLV